MIRLFLVSSLLGLGTVGWSKAQSFDLQCNSNSVPVYEQNDVPLAYGLNTYKFARIEYVGKPLSISIETKGFAFGDSDWDISPHSYGIKGSKEGNKLSFTINRTGYLVFRFQRNQDFAKRLVIFIEPPEVLPEVDLVDIVKTYHVDNTGAKNETEGIQKAFNDISGSGKILFFPDGLYKSFMLKIKSDSKIHLAKNARIIADASVLDSYRAKAGEGINRFF